MKLTRAKVIIGAILAVAVLRAISVWGDPNALNGPPVASAGATSDATDTALKAAMLVNFAEHVPAGISPTDIAVRSKVLIVVTSTPDKAAQQCLAVAAETHSIDTAKPLGVTSVVVISGGAQVANCRVTDAP